MNETLQLVLKECFWGDYHINLQEAENLINTRDESFCKYLVRRIISDSPFPSARLKALFELNYLKCIIDKLPESGRMKDRIRLVRSVLFREPREGYRPWTVH